MMIYKIRVALFFGEIRTKTKGYKTRILLDCSASGPMISSQIVEKIKLVKGKSCKCITMVGSSFTT